MIGMIFFQRYCYEKKTALWDSYKLRHRYDALTCTAMRPPGNPVFDNNALNVLHSHVKYGPHMTFGSIDVGAPLIAFYLMTTESALSFSLGSQLQLHSGTKSSYISILPPFFGYSTNYLLLTA